MKPWCLYTAQGELVCRRSTFQDSSSDDNDIVEHFKGGGSGGRSGRRSSASKESNPKKTKKNKKKHHVDVPDTTKSVASIMTGCCSDCAAKGMICPNCLLC